MEGKGPHYSLSKVFKGCVTMPIYTADSKLLASEIKIDLSPTSKLDFTQATEKANQLTQDNQKIYWNLDFGLFDQLKQPLEDQTQFLSLKYGLDQFLDLLMDNEQWQTESILLAKLKSPFFQHLLELPGFLSKLSNDHGVELTPEEAKDLAPSSPKYSQLYHYSLRSLSDFLSHLTAYISDDLAPSIVIDMSELDTNEQIEIGFGNYFEFLRIYAENPMFLSHFHAYECESSFQTILTQNPLSTIEKPTAALMLTDISDKGEYVEQYSKAIQKLQQENIPFFLVRADQLTMNWEQVDTLFVIGSTLAPFDIRAAFGFEAAEGTIVDLDESSTLPIPDVVSLSDWSKAATT